MDECAEIQQLRKEISALTQDKRKLELDAKRREEAMQSALDKATERAERAELATDVLGKAVTSMPGAPGVDSGGCPIFCVRGLGLQVVRESVWVCHS